MYTNTSINTHKKAYCCLYPISHRQNWNIAPLYMGTFNFPKHFKISKIIKAITYNHPQAIFPGEVFTHRTATTLTITKPPLCINICDPITLNYSELTNIPSVYELSSVCNQCICVTTDVAIFSFCKPSKGRGYGWV